MRVLLVAFYLTLTLFFAFFALSHRDSFAQELDETRQRRGPVRAPLVWENLTKSAQFLCGPKPEYSLRWLMSTVRLEPGESVEFLVPAHELVRVVACDGNRIAGDQVRIWTSNGSGLYRKQNAVATDDGQSVLTAPDQAGISVAKVERPVDMPCGITVAVFTSRRAVPKLLDYYQCPILSSGNEVHISQDNGSKTRQYFHLPANTSRRVEARGPKRLRIEARLKYALDVEQRQTYWLYVYVDGILDRVLSFDTLPQRTRRVFVDGCQRLVGRREFAYIDVDCGDKPIEIRTSHDAYVRIDSVGLDLCHADLNRSFTLPSWENIQKSLSNWDASGLDPSTAALSESFARGDPIAISDPALLWDPYLNQQKIQRLARSNHIRHAGLRAYLWTRAIASLHYGDADYGEEIDVVDLASRIRQRYTIFRDLLPVQIDPTTETRNVAFHNREIRRPNQKRTETIVGEQHVPDALGWLQETTMVRLPLGTESPLIYRFPESLGNSLVRLVVDQTHLTGCVRFLVQYDDRPPIEMAVTPKDAIKPLCFVPGRPEAALSSLASMHPDYDSGTAGGPYAMWNQPAPIVRAATVELLKPANVQSVRIELISCNDAAVDIGVQYMDARKVHLSETAFGHLSQLVQSAAPGSPLFRFVSQELDNNALPVERLLTTHYQTFSRSIERSDQLDKPTEIWDEVILNELGASAAMFAQTQQWPEAIAALTQLIAHSDGETRTHAVLARADALAQAGEFFLSNRELRGWLAYSDDLDLRYAALSKLIESEDDDASLREQYLAFAGIENRGAGFEVVLARQFMENGRFRFALLTLSSLSPTPENHDILLRCSFQTQWWQLFDRVVKWMPDAQQKNLWMGLKALRLGRYTHARRLLQQGGHSGMQWLRHWDSGDQIFRQLKDPTPSARLAALDLWEIWQAEHPGWRTWVNEPSTIKSCVGAAAVYSRSRDLRSQHFVADPAAPGTVWVHGPVRVKIEARPIHDRANTIGVNDWLLLQSAGISKKVPITNNLPSTTLVIEGDKVGLPGGLVTTEIDFPPGLNRFEVSAAKSRILFRVLAARPEIASPVLPIVNETTVATIIRGSFGSNQHQCSRPHGECVDCIRMICRDQECRSVPLSYFSVPCECNELHSAAHYFNRLRFCDAVQWLNRVLPMETELQLVGYDTAWSEAVEAAYLAEQLSESDRTAKMRGLVRLQQWVQYNPPRKDMHRLLSRLRSDTTWASYQQFDARAGIHSLPIVSWSPETPELRIRKSLLVATSKYVLTGSNRLTLNVEDAKATEFNIAIRRPRLSFLPMGRTIAVIDSGLHSQTVELQDPNTTTTIRSQLAPGPGVITISHGNPLANHYLFVDVLEEIDDGELVPLNRERVDSNEIERTYQVATTTEPLIFRVAAPNVLRIDRYDNGVVTHEIVPVDEDRVFTLRPPGGSEMSMFRVFELQRTSAPKSSYRPLPPAPEPTEQWAGSVVQTVFDLAQTELDSNLDMVALLPPDIEPMPIVLRDQDEIGWQRRGTGGLEFGYRSRRALEESPNPRADDQFLHLALSHYYYDQWRDRFTQNALIVRPRFGSGVTLGWNHDGATTISFDKCDSDACADGWGPLQFQWKGYYFHQLDAKTISSSASESPYSFGGSGTISRPHQLTTCVRHRPTISLFGRHLSEDRNGYAPGAIDQDVFTHYKSDHRYGARYSDRWVYQTCLDRRWWLRTSLTSNPDEWVPDNLGFQIGADQLLGPLQFNVAYRLTGYLDDDDRKQASLQNVLYLDLMLEHWHNRIRRSELRFSIRSDLATGDASVGFALASFLNHARAYRDFRPHTVLFRPIREERAAKQYYFGR